MGRPKIYQVRQVRTHYGWAIINEETLVRVKLYVRNRGKCDMFAPGEDVMYFDTVSDAKNAAYRIVGGIPRDVAKNRRKRYRF